MAFKTILIHLERKERVEQLLAVSFSLAKKHDAHLVGLHVIRPFRGYAGGMGGIDFPAELLERNRETLFQESREIERLFTAAAAASGVRAEWQVEETESGGLRTVANHAMCADLIIASQSEDLTIGGGGDWIAELVIESGRPVLLIPNAGKFNGIGTRVLVAWNASRESARAAFDAIPFMKDADDVRILSINDRDRLGSNTITPGADLAVALSRHGVSVEVAATRSGETSIGDELLNRLTDQGCDLLVMGCYGHSRAREMIFGGVTRHILQHMTVPVLMTH